LPCCHVARRKKVMRMRKKASLRRRIGNVYFSQKRRAEGREQTFPFDLGLFRELVEQAVKKGLCDYCQGPLTEESWSLDHMTPVARGGASTGSNLLICCRSCNEAKGILTDREWMELYRVIQGWPDVARQSILRRLRAGGKAIKGG
jgi:5-methylcytosine-specific restriction endonuclease McrA